MIQVEIAGSVGTKQNTKNVVYPFSLKEKDVIKKREINARFCRRKSNYNSRS